MSVQAAVAFLNGDQNEEPDITTTLHRPILPLSKIPSSTTTTNSLLFSKPPPHQWNNIVTTPTSTMKRIHRPTSRSVLDMHTDELTSLYQEALDKLTTANDTIAKLTSDVEIYACDSTKVRDYEIRVEYLAQKLEQVSDERDSLEQELVSYKSRHGDSLVTPVSACFAPDDLFGGNNNNNNNTLEKNHIPAKNENLVTSDDDQQEQRQQQQPVEDTYFDDLLDAYEETGDMQQQHVEEQMIRMQAEYDQGMKMAMESYVADLAQQRLENKTLQTMVKKQEELINKLEQQDPLEQQQQQQQQQQQRPDNDENALLHQQVELQQIELESKRELLTQLLNERNNNTTTIKQQRRSPSFRSSIDVLAEMARTTTDPMPPKSPSSIRSLKYQHQQRDTGRSTPPPFAPPKTPLPPLPATFQNDSSASVNMGMTPTSISYSRSSTSSTSWSSSDEQHQQNLPPQHPLSIIMASPPPPSSKHNSAMAPFVVDSTNSVPPPAPAPSSGSFWKGLKKKF